MIATTIRPLESFASDLANPSSSPLEQPNRELMEIFACLDGSVAGAGAGICSFIDDPELVASKHLVPRDVGHIPPECNA